MMKTRTDVNVASERFRDCHLWMACNYLSVVTEDVSPVLAPPSALILGDVCDDNLSFICDL